MGMARPSVRPLVSRRGLSTSAGRVTSLTARLEGPDSGIDRLLAAAPAAAGKGSGDKNAGEGAVSLAERVRALQKAAGRG